MKATFQEMCNNKMLMIIILLLSLISSTSPIILEPLLRHQQSLSADRAVKGKEAVSNTYNSQHHQDAMSKYRLAVPVQRPLVGNLQASSTTAGPLGSAAILPSEERNPMLRPCMYACVATCSMWRGFNLKYCVSSCAEVGLNNFRNVDEYCFDFNNKQQEEQQEEARIFLK